MFHSVVMESQEVFFPIPISLAKAGEMLGLERAVVRR